MALQAPPTPGFLPARRREGRTSPICPVLSTGSGRRSGLSFPRRYMDKMSPGKPSFRHFQEAIMNEDAFNVSIRKFLKKVGITSQREIEQAVRTALSGGRLKGNEALPAKVTLTLAGIGLSVEIEGDVELE